MRLEINVDFVTDFGAEYDPATGGLTLTIGSIEDRGYDRKAVELDVGQVRKLAEFLRQFLEHHGGVTEA